MSKHCTVAYKMSLVGFAGEDDFDVRRQVGRQPELRFYRVSLRIDAQVNPFQNDNNLRDFLSLVPQIFLLQKIRSDLQPILEISP
jgi:hypothetical protein